MTRSILSCLAAFHAAGCAQPVPRPVASPTPVVEAPRPATPPNRPPGAAGACSPQGLAGFHFRVTNHAGFGQIDADLTVDEHRATLDVMNGQTIGTFRRDLTDDELCALDRAVPASYRQSGPGIIDAPVTSVELRTSARSVQLAFQGPAFGGGIEALLSAVGTLRQRIYQSPLSALQLEVGTPLPAARVGDTVILPVVFHNPGVAPARVVYDGASLFVVAVLRPPPPPPHVQPLPPTLDRVSDPAAPAVEVTIEPGARHTVSVPVVFQQAGPTVFAVRFRRPAQPNAAADPHPPIAGETSTSDVEIAVRPR